MSVFTLSVAEAPEAANTRARQRHRASNLLTPSQIGNYFWPPILMESGAEMHCWMRLRDPEAPVDNVFRFWKCTAPERKHGYVLGAALK